MSETLRYARAYARRGWAVLPCRGKVPAGDLVPHGVKDASTDPATLEQWFADPSLNVGVSCERLAVLDVDPRSDDRGRALHALLGDLGDLPGSAPRVATGGGGVHVWFAGPVRGSKPRPWLDLKGAGGYVVAPPSVHPDTGRVYTFTSEPSGPLPELPERFRGHAGAPARPPEHYAALAAAEHGEGARHVTLASLTGHLLRAGVDPRTAWPLIEAWSARHLRPPLPAEQVERLFLDLCKREAARRSGRRA